MKVSINHSTCPNLTYENFFKLANRLKITNVEIRNDLPNLIFDSNSTSEIYNLKKEYNINIISINALQKFNIWDNERKEELLFLCRSANEINCEGIVLVPLNSGNFFEKEKHQTLLKNSLKEIDFILSEYQLKGFIEPLGFKSSSLRYKSEVIDQLKTLRVDHNFSLVHDTFHHKVAEDESTYVENTSIVHISGVNNREIKECDFTDDMRELINESDQIKNIQQINYFLSNKYDGFFSIEPFSEKIQNSDNHYDLIKESLNYINKNISY